MATLLSKPVIKSFMHKILKQGRRRGVFKVFTEYLNIFSKEIKKNHFSSFENLEKENRLRRRKHPMKYVIIAMPAIRKVNHEQNN